MKEVVIRAVSEALQQLNKGWGLEELPDVDVEVPRDEVHGDLATTVAMMLARRLRRPPRDIATEVVQEINRQSHPFETIEVAGAGFINFRFRREYLYERLEVLLQKEHSEIRTDIGKGQKVQVEFVSANPTGPLHIGHGRGAAVGNALCNLLSAAGFDVQREYYINDAGLQVRLLGLSVYTIYQHLLGNLINFPEDGYRGEYIKEIAEEIRDKAGDRYFNIPFEVCKDFFINYSYKRMLADITKDLRDFGVEFDSWQSERELYEKQKVQDLLKELQERGLIYEKDGALWFSSSRFGDEKDRVVVKSDGEYTYFASDIAYHKEKLDRGFDTIIDIWGADHHGYIPRVRSALRAFGLPEERFRVILVQMVTLYRDGSPVQMSKRSGEFITLREVMDEVGADVAKFIFLTRRPDSQLDFDIGVVKKESSENPVFYVQYAFARISSIFRKAVERGILGSEDRRQNTEHRGQKTEHRGQKTEHRRQNTEHGEIEEDAKEVDLSLLREEEEIEIIKKLLHYPMVFEGAVNAFEPHRITFYLQELSGLFHSYYNKHRVISDDQNLTTARLCLCKAIQIVLEEGLGILGVKAPERM
jgi:arginyl-tRNA synthetase